MMHKRRIELGPVLVVAVGIVLSTGVAMLASGAEALTIAAALLLAVSLLAADMLTSWRRGRSLRPTPASLLAALTFLVAAGLVLYSDPTLVVVMLPIIGAGSAIAILYRSIYR